MELDLKAVAVFSVFNDWLKEEDFAQLCTFCEIESFEDLAKIQSFEKKILQFLISVNSSFKLSNSSRKVFKTSNPFHFFAYLVRRYVLNDCKEVIFRNVKYNFIIVLSFDFTLYVYSSNPLQNEVLDKIKEICQDSDLYILK